MKKFVIIFGFFLFLISPTLAFAQIDIPQRSGNLFVATEKGDVFTVGRSDNLPKVASGSVIEVLSGQAEFKVEGSDILSVVGGEAVMNLTGGNNILVDVKENGSNTRIEVVNGELQVMLGETILTVKSGGAIETKITDGNASVSLVKGEAMIMEFGGNLKKLVEGQSYDLGSVTQSFSKESRTDAEEMQLV